jgi:ParB family chromosome partitioning protein
VTHYLRILQLPDDVQELIEDGRLSAGHARVIASLSAQEARHLAHEADKRKWSVRQLEVQVKALRQKTVAVTGRPDSDVARLERLIGEHLGAPCSLVAKKDGAGRLVINYHSLDELSGILQKIGVSVN